MENSPFWLIFHGQCCNLAIATMSILLSSLTLAFRGLTMSILLCSLTFTFGGLTSLLLPHRNICKHVLSLFKWENMFYTKYFSAPIWRRLSIVKSEAYCDIDTMHKSEKTGKNMLWLFRWKPPLQNGHWLWLKQLKHWQFRVNRYSEYIYIFHQSNIKKSA